MLLRCVRAGLLGVCITVASVPVVFAGTSSDYFNAGFKAAAKGDYLTALAQFKKAEQVGMGGSPLQYNMAISFYRLQRYEEARQAFQVLMDVPKFEQIAYFNLGLIANKQKDEPAAVRWFRRAYHSGGNRGDNRKIKTLATKALQRLSASPSRVQKAGRDWFGFVSSSLSYDTNVTLINNDLLGATNENDTLLNVSVLASRWLKGRVGRGTRMSLSANTQQYRQVSNVDYSQFSIGADRYDRLGAWRMRFGGSWDEIYYAGSEYERIVSAEVRGRKSLSAAHQLRLRYKLSRIQATDAAFDYLNGWRQQFRLGLRRHGSVARIVTYYQLELNDRKDRQGVIGPFTSYSPTRHTLRVTTWWPIVDTLKLKLDGRYRYSRYNDSNILTGGAIIRREDDQYRIAIGLKKILARAWRLNGSYSYTRNDSNIDRRRYDNSVFKLDVTWMY
jgi:tetratricopeptide (TPR) repeat protein